MKTVLPFFLVIVLAELLTVSPSASAQTTIFSNLSPTNSWAVDGEQFGEEVTVSGANWQVTSLQIEIYSQGIFPTGADVGPGFADFQASLYANNGPQGAPGTLLWQSAFVPDNYPSGLSLLTYAVPNVAVPSQFTWVLQYTNYSNPNAPPSLPVANAPTIGTYDIGWFGEPAFPWTKLTTEDGDGFMAQIIAVPEPGTGILLFAGVAAYVLRKRIFRSAGGPRPTHH